VVATGCKSHTWVAGSYGAPPTTRTILNAIYAPSSGSPFSIGGELLKQADSSFYSGVVLNSAGSGGAFGTASETTSGMPGYLDQQIWTMTGSASGDLYIAGTGGSAWKRSSASGPFTKLAATGMTDDIYASWEPSTAAGVFLAGVGGKLSYVDSSTVKALDCHNVDPSCTNPATFYGLWGTDGSTYTAYAVGRGGIILRMTGANDPVKETNPTVNDMNAIWGVSATEIYAVGDAGTILKSTGGSGTGSWKALTSGVTANLLSVAGVGGEVYAVGAAGTVLCSSDQGVTWVTVNTGALTNQDLTAVWGAGGKVVIVGRASQILVRQ
jgi:photosystem II stability/assembly factor-like uncharacterized protein